LVILLLSDVLPVASQTCHQKDDRLTATDPDRRHHRPGKAPSEGILTPGKTVVNCNLHR